MIEVLQALAYGLCQQCLGQITQTVGEWSPEQWTHDSNGRPECPGAPVAEPFPHSVVPHQNTASQPSQEVTE